MEDHIFEENITFFKGKFHGPKEEVSPVGCCPINSFKKISDKMKTSFNVHVWVKCFNISTYQCVFEGMNFVMIDGSEVLN